MSQTNNLEIIRLANYVSTLEKKQEVYFKLSDVIESLRKSGIAVLGEFEFLKRLENLLEDAKENINKISLAKNELNAIEYLNKLEEIFTDFKWDLADTILADLETKDVQTQEKINSYEDQIIELDSNIKNLTELLDGANVVKAPVIKEKKEINEIISLVESAKRSIRNKVFGELMQIIPKLEEKNKDILRLNEEISKKNEAYKGLSQQADLLLIQSPLTQYYDYTVLLRTPSGQGTHGINIQDSSQIVAEDRKEIRDTIDLVTHAINVGLTRQFSESHQEAKDKLEDFFLRTRDSPTRDAKYVKVYNDVTQDKKFQNVNEMLQNIGDLMFKLCIPDEMKNYFIDSQFSITLNTNDLELPWELMSYDGKFLCLEKPVARMPMGKAFPRKYKEIVKTEKVLNFLLIYSDYKNNLTFGRNEIKLIEEKLTEDWESEVKIKTLIQEEATGRALNDVLRTGTYDVIHYIGHAMFDEEKPDLSGLLLYGGERFFAQKMKRLLEGKPLVFLNACQTGRSANEETPQMIEDYLQKPAEGLASSMIYGGALGCIGSLWPIYDRPAAEFAVEFYSKVLEGCMIGDAMRCARSAIYQKYPNQITWAAFVLYGNPTYRLVE